jgi:tetratricopeptide (TPR) repeat protein
LLIFALALAGPACTGRTRPPEGELPDDTIEGSLARDAVEEAGAHLLAGRPEKGLSVADAALVGDPDNAELHYVRGAALQALGRGPEALDAFAEAVRLAPELAAAHDAMGSVHLDAGRLDEAVAAFERALALAPELASAHFNLGLAHARAGRVAPGIAALQRAHELAPTDADTLLELAALQEKGGDLPGAKATLARAVEVAPKDAFVRMVHGDVLRAGGDEAGSLAAWTEAVRLDPDLADARLRLVRALRRAQRATEALEHAAILVEQLPENAIAWSDYGGVLVDLGRTDEALAALGKALALEPGLVSAHRRRIDAHVAVGQCAAAKAALAELEKVGAPGDAIAPARKQLAGCKKR